MAFYGSEGGFDERYSSGYEHAQYPCPYELGVGEPNLYKDDYSCYNLYEYSVNPSDNYQVYFPSEAKFTIAYSSSGELKEPEFEEYDPTPYDGGYDQAVTYGKPLPPSDLICYPRSQPKSNTPLDNFSYDSTPPPCAKDDPLPLPLQPSIDNGGRAAEPSGGYPSYEHQNGHQIPYGSGLEAMDICETIFGYWPCLAKKAHQQMNHHCDQDTIIDPWKAAADYFFGTPLPYDL